MVLTAIVIVGDLILMLSKIGAKIGKMKVETHNKKVRIWLEGKKGYHLYINRIPREVRLYA